MITDDYQELEYSPLCGTLSRDGIAVRVEIYRFAGSGEGCSLEVIDQDIQPQSDLASVETVGFRPENFGAEKAGGGNTTVTLVASGRKVPPLSCPSISTRKALP